MTGPTQDRGGQGGGNVSVCVTDQRKSDAAMAVIHHMHTKECIASAQ